MRCRADTPPSTQGNGPVGGTLVEHRVCLVSSDWLAADRVAVELTGIDYRVSPRVSHRPTSLLAMGSQED